MYVFVCGLWRDLYANFHRRRSEYCSQIIALNKIPSHDRAFLLI